MCHQHQEHMEAATTRNMKYSDRKREVMLLAEKQGGRCALCGDPLNMERQGAPVGNDATIEHIVPRYLVGKEAYEHKALVCRDCNLGDRFHQGLAASLVHAGFRVEKFRDSGGTHIGFRIRGTDYRIAIIGDSNIFRYDPERPFYCVLPALKGRLRIRRLRDSANEHIHIVATGNEVDTAIEDIRKRLSASSLSLPKPPQSHYHDVYRDRYRLGLMRPNDMTLNEFLDGNLDEEIQEAKYWNRMSLANNETVTRARIAGTSIPHAGTGSHMEITKSCFNGNKADRHIQIITDSLYYRGRLLSFRNVPGKKGLNYVLVKATFKKGTRRKSFLLDPTFSSSIEKLKLIQKKLLKHNKEHVIIVEDVPRLFSCLGFRIESLVPLMKEQVAERAYRKVLKKRAQKTEAT